MCRHKDWESQGRNCYVWAVLALSFFAAAAAPLWSQTSCQAKATRKWEEGKERVSVLRLCVCVRVCMWCNWECVCVCAPVRVTARLSEQPWERKSVSLCVRRRERECVWVLVMGKVRLLRARVCLGHFMLDSSPSRPLSLDSTQRPRPKFCLQFSNHLNTELLNTGQYGTSLVWVSGIQTVKSHDLADHLNTRHFGP